MLLAFYLDVSVNCTLTIGSPQLQEHLVSFVLQLQILDSQAVLSDNLSNFRPWYFCS